MATSSCCCVLGITVAFFDTNWQVSWLPRKRITSQSSGQLELLWPSHVLDFLKFDSSYNHERWCHLLAAEVRSKGLDTRKMPESTWLNEWNISSDIPWSEREKTSKIIYKRLGLLKRLKRFLSSRERVMFYNDLVQASMDSAAWVCSDSFIGHSNTKLCLQKYPVRIIMNYPWDASSTSLLSDLNIHPLQERVAKIKER